MQSYALFEHRKIEREFRSYRSILLFPPVNFVLQLCRGLSFESANQPTSRATLHQTAARSACVANLCLSILAAAALHGEERGEAEDDEEKRTHRHGCGELPIGFSFLSLHILPREKCSLANSGGDTATNGRSKMCLLAVLYQLTFENYDYKLVIINNNHDDD